MYALGCSDGGIQHLRLDETNYTVDYTAAFSTDSTDVGGMGTGNAFLIEALELSVVLGRNDSDEVNPKSLHVLQAHQKTSIVARVLSARRRTLVSTTGVPLYTMR